MEYVYRDVVTLTARHSTTRILRLTAQICGASANPAIPHRRETSCAACLVFYTSILVRYCNKRCVYQALGGPAASAPVRAAREHSFNGYDVAARPQESKTFRQTRREHSPAEMRAFHLILARILARSRKDFRGHSRSRAAHVRVVRKLGRSRSMTLTWRAPAERAHIRTFMY